MLKLILELAACGFALLAVDNLALRFGVATRSWTMSFVRAVVILTIFSLIQPLTSRAQLLVDLVIFTVLDHWWR